MAEREDILTAVAGLYAGSVRSPIVYDFDNLPQTGIVDGREEATPSRYNYYIVDMPVTVEQIDFFQSVGAAADPEARALARSQKAQTMIDTIARAMIDGFLAGAFPAVVTKLDYTGAEPIYQIEDTNYIGVVVDFLIQYKYVIQE